ncbi:uncharacterized protein A4U43_UnF5760 [Asparagus officinalis]|uniref:Uncharacterized protein n=1 Tax=Asparagus officinalis TaxID=4686 RepID=A0A1R3L6M7_ASPOF|nr:uncharacterized protein A4U43_UnF5760 [Asparagus officinalis]
MAEARSSKEEGSKFDTIDATKAEPFKIMIYGITFGKRTRMRPHPKQELLFILNLAASIPTLIATSSWPPLQPRISLVVVDKLQPSRTSWSSSSLRLQPSSKPYHYKLSPSETLEVPPPQTSPPTPPLLRLV